MFPALRSTPAPNAASRTWPRTTVRRSTRTWAVREPRPPRSIAAGGYEDEGAERVSRASLAVTTEAWWTASLVVPLERDVGAAPIAFLRLERHGAPLAAYRGDVEIEFSVPAAELGSVATLLSGLIEQGRRDGTLGAP